MEHDLSFVIILIAVLGIGAQWLAWRFRLPAVILLALVGILAGPVLGWIVPRRDFGALFDPLVHIALAIIVFEGGLSLRRHELEHVGHGVKRLISAGVILTWLLAAMAAYYIGGLSWPVANLFGAIIVVTDSSVMMTLLRHARLQPRAAAMLKWEAILNDPLGTLLAVLVFEYYMFSHGTSQLTEVSLNFARGMISSVALAVASGYLTAFLFRRNHIPEFLKAPLIFGMILVVFGGTNAIQEQAGLFAATLFGIVLANVGWEGIVELRRFQEYIAVLLVSGVFVLLAADIEPDILTNLNWRSAALLGVTLLVIRPAAVVLSTLGTDLNWKEKALLAWVAPRGIVAAAMAGFFAIPMAKRGYTDAALLVPLVFAVSAVTIIGHGLTIGWLGRKLGLAAGRQQGLLIVGASQWSVALAQTLLEMKVPVLLADSDWNRLKPARLAGVPVYFGEVLSDASEHTLDLSEIGVLLAATDNDAYNALVCMHLTAELGRDWVYQLPMREVPSTEGQALSQTSRGHLIMNETETFHGLLHRLQTGWTFTATAISEGYSYLKFRTEHVSAQPVLLLHGKRELELEFKLADSPIQPKAGDTLVSFGPPRAATAAQ